MSLYETLGVNENASADEIESAYRRRARETHPDRGGEHDQFLAVARAYDVLGDSRRRAEYDRTGSTDEVPDQLMSLIAVVFNQVVESARSAGALLAVDVVKSMRQHLERSKAEFERQKRSLQAERSELNEAISRFSFVAGDKEHPGGPLADMLRSRVKEIESRFTRMDADIEAANRALAFLADQRYRADIFKAGTWRGIHTTTFT